MIGAPPNGGGNAGGSSLKSSETPRGATVAVLFVGSGSGVLDAATALAAQLENAGRSRKIFALNDSPEPSAVLVNLTEFEIDDTCTSLLLGTTAEIRAVALKAAMMLSAESGPRFLTVISANTSLPIGRRMTGGLRSPLRFTLISAHVLVNAVTDI
jgi:hypothetical protein